MPRKKKKSEVPKEDKASFHEGLEGFDIKVNSFGQMETSFEIDKLNAFLNKQKAKAENKAENKAEAEGKVKSEE
ncbi:MAG TPA: hypothetical protein VLA46_01810 [Saprospiraceae bacterium]|nr:hypothetical protein [Saprospiraceae bacterium]